jgi:predicted TIM-barrel fold metal-dependent hydrolase
MTRDMVRKLEFFDVNTSVGVWKHPNYGGYEQAQELESILDYLEVKRAVVYHAQAHETDAVVGNQILLEELRDHPRLMPSWVLFPHHTGEFPGPEKIIKDMLAHRVRIVRLLPGYEGHRFCMADWCAGDLLQQLEKHRIPTLIDFMFFRRDDPNWGLLYDVCHRYPKLPIILTGWSGLASRSFFPLCNACDNLYLDTSRYALFRGIEAFVKHVGARRLIYGSGMPRIGPGVSMTTITHAFIRKEERQLIAYKNLERLLDRVIL